MLFLQEKKNRMMNIDDAMHNRGLYFLDRVIFITVRLK
jgi:hypothetical protein